MIKKTGTPRRCQEARQFYDYSRLRAVGSDVVVAAGITLRHPSQVSVGSHVAIDEGFYCSTSATIGDYVHIGAQCCVIGGVKSRLVVGNFCGMSAGCRLACGGDDFLGSGLIGPTVPMEYRAVLTCSSIILEDFVQLGMGVIVLPGVRLREGCVVGAGSVVLADCSPWQVYVGVPARPIKKRFRRRLLDAAHALGYR